MLHAAHFLGFDPFKPPILLGGWADMFPLPNWRELQPHWDAMFPDETAEYEKFKRGKS